MDEFEKKIVIGDTAKVDLVPHSLPLEEAVLGALLLEKSAYEQILDTEIKAEDFYKDDHAIIFNAIQSVYEKGIPIDLLTVRTQLEKTKELQKIGGAYALVRLTTEVSTSSNVAYHIHEIIELAIRREAYFHGINLKTKALSLGNDIFESIDECIDVLSQKQNSIKKAKTEQIALLQGDVLKEIEEAKKLRESKGLVGLPSGIKEFDELTGGFRKQELTFIGARPSHGKTNVFNQIASLSSRYDDGIFVIFSLEMSKNKLGLRMNAFEAGEPYQDFLKGTYTEEQKQKLVSHPVSENIFINDKTDVTSKDIRKVVYSLSKKYKILGVGIDYIQMFKDVSNKVSRHLFLEMESYALKAIAKEFDIPVIALVQTNREAEEKKETSVRHLKESAGMEQAADVIIFLECVKKWGIDFIEVEDEYGLKQELDTYDPTTNYLLHNFNVVKNRNGAVKNIIVEGDIARGRYWSYNYSLYLKNWINKRYE